MEKTIPIVKFDVEHKDSIIAVEMYAWLTQIEEDEATNIIMGEGVGLDSIGEDGQIAKRVSTKTLLKSQQYTLECVLIKPNFIEYNQLEPSLRVKIKEKVTDELSKKK